MEECHLILLATLLNILAISIYQMLICFKQINFIAAKIIYIKLRCYFYALQVDTTLDELRQKLPYLYHQESVFYL